MQYRIGIDMGGTAIKAGIVDENYQVVYRHSRPTGQGFERVVADMAAAAREVAEMAGLAVSDFPCVGVGTPSTLCSFGLVVVYCRYVFFSGKT